MADRPGSGGAESVTVVPARRLDGFAQQGKWTGDELLFWKSGTREWYPQRRKRPRDSA